MEVISSLLLMMLGTFPSNQEPQHEKMVVFAREDSNWDTMPSLAERPNESALGVDAALTDDL